MVDVRMEIYCPVEYVESNKTERKYDPGHFVDFADAVKMFVLTLLSSSVRRTS